MGRVIFEEIRNRPYSVGANKDEKSQNCYTKNTELIGKLAELGYAVRGRLGDIDWSDLGLPSSLIDLYPKDIQPTHFYCEILKDNEWLVLDASWEPVMKAAGAVSEWDHANIPGFKIRHLYTIEEQTRFFEYWSDPIRGDDYFHRAGSFLHGFNEWVIEQRAKALA